MIVGLHAHGGNLAELGDELEALEEELEEEEDNDCNCLKDCAPASSCEYAPGGHRS